MVSVLTLLEAAEEVITSTIQRDSVISFPMFGEGFSINPPAYFTLFGRNIYFYGVFIALGFICGILWMTHHCDSFGIKEDDVYDLVLFIIPLSILGARLYFVAFQWDYYSQHLNEFLAVWEGGLAIYGGVIAGILVLFFVARHKKIPFLAFLDLVIVGLVIGQIIGRWGNFMNREAFGSVTTVFCRMGLTDPYGHTIYVHPTFLYESLWNLAGFCFMVFWLKSGRRRYDGQLALIYFFWYGLGRTWIEGLRTDSLYIGSTGIRVSQLISVIMCVVALVHLVICARRSFTPDKLYVNRVLAAKATLSVAPAAESEAAPAAEAPATDISAAEPAAVEAPAAPVQPETNGETAV